MTSGRLARVYLGRGTQSLALLVAVCLAGCGGKTAPSKHVTSELGMEPGASRAEKTHIVDLGAGRASGSFAIHAPDPRRNTFTVSLSAPAANDVSLAIRTWYGVRLQILTSSRDRGVCERHGSRVACLARFPSLEAQRPGRWTFVVAKRSGAAARVTVQVAFTPA